MEIAIERWSLNFTDPDVERLYQKIEARRSRLFRLATLLGCVFTECIIIPMDLLSYMLFIIIIMYRAQTNYPTYTITRIASQFAVLLLFVICFLLFYLNVFKDAIHQYTFIVLVTFVGSVLITFVFNILYYDVYSLLIHLVVNYSV